MSMLDDLFGASSQYDGQYDSDPMAMQDMYEPGPPPANDTATWADPGEPAGNIIKSDEYFAPTDMPTWLQNNDVDKEHAPQDPQPAFAEPASKMGWDKKSLADPAREDYLTKMALWEDKRARLDAERAGPQDWLSKAARAVWSSPVVPLITSMAPKRLRTLGATWAGMHHAQNEDNRRRGYELEREYSTLQGGENARQRALFSAKQPNVTPLTTSEGYGAFNHATGQIEPIMENVPVRKPGGLNTEGDSMPDTTSVESRRAKPPSEAAHTGTPSYHYEKDEKGNVSVFENGKLVSGSGKAYIKPTPPKGDKDQMATYNRVFNSVLGKLNANSDEEPTPDMYAKADDAGRTAMELAKNAKAGNPAADNKPKTLKRNAVDSEGNKVPWKSTDGGKTWKKIVE